MSEDRGSYSEEESALVLRKTAELASDSEQSLNQTDSGSIEDMKWIAEEAGIDPSFVERTALSIHPPSGVPLFERLFGGPLTSRLELQFQGRLTEEESEELVGIARTIVGTSGTVEAYPTLMSWTSVESGGMVEESAGTVSVSAQSEGERTHVSILVDNRFQLIKPWNIGVWGMSAVLIAAIGFGLMGPLGSGAIPGLPFFILLVGWSGASVLVWRSIRRIARTTRRTVDRLVEGFSRFLNRVSGNPDG